MKQVQSEEKCHLNNAWRHYFRFSAQDLLVHVSWNERRVAL